MEVEAIVIGAGVVGLAVARALAASGRETLVLEAEPRIGAHTSSHNSEVIHAGLYYPDGSLRARACVAGRKKLYAFCRAHGVAARRIGKLIVAGDDAQATRLAALFRQGQRNGVDDLVWMGAREAAAIEPEVVCRAAIFSPSTGILDSFSYMLALQAEAESCGAQVVPRCRVARVTRRGGAFDVHVAEAPDEALGCRLLVNCAGHGAQEVAAAFEDYPRNLIPPRFFAKGNYCSVSGPTPFSHLVYPLPEPGALGVHVTLDLAGRMRLGPDIQWTDGLDYVPTEGVAAQFMASAAQYWPGVRARELSVSHCGVRPKISGPGAPQADFRIDGPELHGVDGLVHCFGIESPGLTASLALADMIVERLTARPPDAA